MTKIVVKQPNPILIHNHFKVCQQIELDNPKNYRAKMRGFQRVPFSIQEKETHRMPKEYIEHYRVQPKQITERIVEEIKKARKEKNLASPSITMKSTSPIKFSSASKRSISQIEVERQPLSSHRILKKGKGKNLAESHTAKPPSEDKPTFTFVGLGSSTYEDVKFFQDAPFHPSNLISYADGDKESVSVLKKFQSCSALPKNTHKSGLLLNLKLDSKQAKGEIGEGSPSSLVKSKRKPKTGRKEDSPSNSPVYRSSKLEEIIRSKQQGNIKPAVSTIKKSLEAAQKFQERANIQAEKNLNHIIEVQDSKAKRALRASEKQKISS